MAFQNVWARLSPIAWLFPIAVMALGALFAPLRVSVGQDISSISLTPGLLGQVVLLGAWLVAENLFATSRSTKISQLQRDAFLSILLALVLSFGSGWLLARGECPWLYVMPTVTAIVDAFLTSNQALNTAAQRRTIARDAEVSS
jgi:hypothetical protein